MPAQVAAPSNGTNWREPLLPAISANVPPISAQIATVAANIFAIIAQVLAVIPNIALVFANVACIAASVFVISVAKVIPHVAAIFCDVTFIATYVLPIGPSVDPILPQLTPIRADVAMIIHHVLSQRKNRSQHGKAQPGNHSSFHIASPASGLNWLCGYKHIVQVKVAASAGRGRHPSSSSEVHGKFDLTGVLSIENGWLPVLLSGLHRHQQQQLPTAAAFLPSNY
jgi:hypothetical protein